MDLRANHLRSYRAHLRSRDRRYGGQLQGASLVTSHKAIKTFLRWLRDENAELVLDARSFTLTKPREPQKEATVFDLEQLRQILAACQSATDEMVVHLALGAGLRESEICGIAIKGPDGMPDLVPDAVEIDRWLLRVRWDGGSKGKKSRFVPISLKLATAIKRYITKAQPSGTPYPNLLISRVGRPLSPEGIKSLMDRIKRRVGFRVHAHAFRHTYATVSAQMDVNLEKLRGAMGHEDYDSLLRYVKQANARPLGSGKEWSEYVWVPPHRRS